MPKTIIRWLDPILLIGVLISIGISVAMVLSGNDTLSGLMVGLLSTIVTLLVDIIARVQKVKDDLFLELDEVNHSLKTTVQVQLLSSREAVYREVRLLIMACSGTEIIRATSVGEYTFHEKEIEHTEYLEMLAKKISQSKHGKLGMLYKTVISSAKKDFDFAMNTRYQIFQRQDVSDRLEIHSSDNIWSMDLLIIGSDHLIMTFPTEGRSHVIRLGIRISNREFVENVTRWFDECIWGPTSAVSLDNKVDS